MIAALYVQTNGAYYGIDGVDPWDEARDARNYAGPWPVVAHPPCNRWGQLGLVNWIRYGGEHNRPGNDGGCFAAALAAVRKWGGVLEHPATTRAWAAHGLLKPVGRGWQRTLLTPDEWVCEVWQSAYGHAASKATWLFVSGCVPPAIDWSRRPGTHTVGRMTGQQKPYIQGAAASATPPAFRDLLISIAREVQS